MGGPICKIAFKTILRYGWAAIIFLTLGLYFLFPACKSWEEIQKERKQPYELQGMVAGTAQLEKYMEVENIQAVSPVISFQATLSDGSFSLSTPVNAVSAGYVRLELKEGNLFHDQSNMPFVILNSYAAKHFVDEDKKESVVHINDSVMISLNNSEEKAVICGIFEDDTESPIAYMSYYEAAKYFPKEETVNLLFLLTGKGAAEKAVKDLNRQSVDVALDENAIVRWKLLQQQAAQYLILALGFLVCSIVLMHQRNRLEEGQFTFEYQRLLLSGLTSRGIRKTRQFRIWFTYGFCLAAASLTAWILGKLVPTAGLAVIFSVLLHYLFVYPTE